jgi:hypothetical protein
MSAIGQAGLLTILVTLEQFTRPHTYLSTATSLAFSARAFGSAVLDVIKKNKLATTYAREVGKAATNAGPPQSYIPVLLGALAAGNPTAFGEIGAINPDMIAMRFPRYSPKKKHSKRFIGIQYK